MRSVVCETVIVSGKLSQEAICSSGLKAAGGRQPRCKGDARGERLRRLCSPAAAAATATEYLTRPKLRRSPEWAARGRTPRPRLER